MRRAAAIVALLAAVWLYTFGEESNPPGFYVDESAIAYNALCLARTGADQFGVRFPLFFRSFGEWKNPVYIYGLAAAFRLSYPSNLVARRFSNILGIGAALLLAWLALAITRRRWIAGAVFFTALITPDLYEVSRLVFEVAFLPIAMALFFLAVWRASRRERWSAADIVFIAGALVLITFSYSTGRLLAPLLLAGVVLFYYAPGRFRWLRDGAADRDDVRPATRNDGVVAVVALYVLFGLAPLVAFDRMHDGALLIRARQLSYLPEHPVAQADITLSELESHFIGNLLPVGLALQGDLITRHHVRGGGGEMLLGTLVLVAFAIVDIARRRDRWWMFVLYATLVSAIPASLTIDRYHALRLVSFVVCLLVLLVRGLEVAPRQVIAAAAVLCVAQAVWYFANYARHGGERKLEFDAGARRVVEETLSRGVRPVYLRDPVYGVHSLWYAAQIGVPRSAFVIISDKDPAPPHVLLIELGDHCEGCELVSHHGEFWSHMTR